MILKIFEIYCIILGFSIIHHFIVKTPIYKTIFKSLKAGEYSLMVVMQDGTYWFLNKNIDDKNSPLFKPIRFTDRNVDVVTLSTFKWLVYLFYPIDIYWEYILLKWFKEHKEFYKKSFGRSEYVEVIDQLKIVLENEKY